MNEKCRRPVKLCNHLGDAEFFQLPPGKVYGRQSQTHPSWRKGDLWSPQKWSNISTGAQRACKVSSLAGILNSAAQSNLNQMVLFQKAHLDHKRDQRPPRVLSNLYHLIDYTSYIQLTHVSINPILFFIITHFKHRNFALATFSKTPGCINKVHK